MADRSDHAGAHGSGQQFGGDGRRQLIGPGTMSLDPPAGAPLDVPEPHAVVPAAQQGLARGRLGGQNELFQFERGPVQFPLTDGLGDPRVRDQPPPDGVVGGAPPGDGLNPLGAD